MFHKGIRNLRGELGTVSNTGWQVIGTYEGENRSCNGDECHRAKQTRTCEPGEQDQTTLIEKRAYRPDARYPLYSPKFSFSNDPNLFHVERFLDGSFVRFHSAGCRLPLTQA